MLTLQKLNAVFCFRFKKCFNFFGWLIKLWPQPITSNVELQNVNNGNETKLAIHRKIVLIITSKKKMLIHKLTFRNYAISAITNLKYKIWVKFLFINDMKLKLWIIVKKVFFTSTKHNLFGLLSLIRKSHLN